MGKKAPMSLTELEAYQRQNVEELGPHWLDRVQAIVGGWQDPVSGETSEAFLEKIMQLEDEVIFTYRVA